MLEHQPSKPCQQTLPATLSTLPAIEEFDSLAPLPEAAEALALGQGPPAPSSAQKTSSEKKVKELTGMDIVERKKKGKLAQFGDIMESLPAQFDAQALPRNWYKIDAPHSLWNP